MAVAGRARPGAGRALVPVRRAAGPRPGLPPRRPATPGHWLVDTAAGRRPRVALGVAGGRVARVRRRRSASPATSSPRRRPRRADPESVVIGPAEATTTTAAPPPPVRRAGPGARLPATTTDPATAGASARRRRRRRRRRPSTPRPRPSATRCWSARRRRSPPAWAPALTVDAEVGRQLERRRRPRGDLARGGQLGQVVLVNLGNNGPFTRRADRRAVRRRRARPHGAARQRRRAPAVGGRGQRPARAAAAGRHPNAVLVDWRSLVTTEPGLLARTTGSTSRRPAPSATPTWSSG